MKLYDELADWWPLLSRPADYEEEAAFYSRVLVESCGKKPVHVLEIGSGGGNNASYMKAHFQMTLVDLSPGMLAVSKALNPELEHLQGDMRTVRLGREFDAVFIHDAICYMSTEEDLRAAIETMYVHCRLGGAALFCPDNVRENLRPSTDHGGHDGPSRSLRYLEWTVDDDPQDDTYETYMIYALREADGSMRVEHERWTAGLFSTETWLQLIRDVGFAESRVLPFEHSELELGSHCVFVGIKS